MTVASRARPAAERFGRRAEGLARALLRLKGYAILARDLRTPVGEIDIVARRGRTLAFVEVKARAAGDLATVLTARQRRRIVRAASLFIASHPDLRHLQPRFDLIFIGRRLWPRHLPDAWRSDGVL